MTMCSALDAAGILTRTGSGVRISWWVTYSTVGVLGPGSDVLVGAHDVEATSEIAAHPIKRAPRTTLDGMNNLFPLGSAGRKRPEPWNGRP
jgi:hypothetical protein